MSITSVNLRSCSQQKKTTKQVERLCASSTRLAGKKLQPKVVKKLIKKLVNFRAHRLKMIIVFKALSKDKQACPLHYPVFVLHLFDTATPLSPAFLVPGADLPRGSVLSWVLALHLLVLRLAKQGLACMRVRACVRACVRAWTSI